MWLSIIASTHICLILLLTAFLQHSSVFAYQTIIDVLSNDTRFETLLKQIQAARLVPILNDLTTGTLFAPDNDAFTNYQGPAITNETLLYHLLPRDLSATQFHHHQIIESSLQLKNYLRHNTGQRLLIHKPADHASASSAKASTTFFVNDAQLIDVDVPVNSKTIIHVVNKVLQPPVMIPQAFAHRNTDLYQMMDKVGLIRMLNHHQPYTVFYSDQSILAPFNEAEVGYLLSAFGDEDLLGVLGYLIIRGDIYAEDFIGEKQYKTINGETLTIKADKEKDILTVNDQPVIQKDLLAANGVLHKVKSMPITNQLTFDTRKYLYGINATKFVSLLDQYGLGYYLAPGVTNFTFLALDNDAINEDALPDNEKKAWLSYHLLNGRWDPHQLHDQQLVASELKSPKLNRQPQQVSVSLTEGRRTIIYFNNARVYGNSLVINNNMIYQLPNPMELPHDVFSSIVVDLDLSSFIATLYVSNMVDQIKDAKGITLFAPVNQAYQSLGLLGTYLLHPTGRRDLQTTLQYHAAQSLLYGHDLQTSTYNVTTFTERDTLSVGGLDDQGRIMIGNGKGRSGTVQHTNTLMANGVIHKVDTVMIPPSISLTHCKLLCGMEAHRVLGWFDDFSWLGAGGDYILLAPTDHAFAKLDEYLGEGWEENDRDAYDRLVRLHVIPKAQQQRRHSLLDGQIETYPTLLSDWDQVVVHDGGYFDEQFVQVVGKTGQGARAHILAKGNLHQYAQVIQVDAVLLPIPRGLFGLPRFWSVALVAAFITIAVTLLTWVAHYLWQRYRRCGYEIIEEEESQDQEPEPGSSGYENNYSSITNNNNNSNGSLHDNEEDGTHDPHASHEQSAQV